MSFQSFELPTLLDILSDVTNYHKTLLTTDSDSKEVEDCKKTILSVQFEIERRQLPHVCGNK